MTGMQIIQRMTCGSFVLCQQLDPSPRKGPIIFVASKDKIMLLDTANEVIMVGMRFTHTLSAAGLISNNSH